MTGLSAIVRYGRGMGGNTHTRTHAHTPTNPHTHTPRGQRYVQEKQ